MWQHAELPGVKSSSRQWHKVYSPRGEKPFKCILLGGEVVELWVHWSDYQNRTIPCEGIEDCEFCKEGIDRRYKQWRSAYSLGINMAFVLELTEGAARKLDELLAGVSDARGKVIQLRRKTKNRNSAVLVEIVSDYDTSKITEKVDVYSSLLRLWGIKNEK